MQQNGALGRRFVAGAVEQARNVICLTPTLSMV
jgi:hypothetical protein